MAIKNEYMPCLAIPPGETLEEQLQQIGMTQVEFSKRTGLTTKHINEIINGKASITPETALRFESVLGIPASFWNNLEANYQETKARIEAEQQLQSEIELARSISYAEMAKLEWVPKTSDWKEKVFNLRNFFGVAALEYIPNVIPVAFRKSEIKDASALSLAAWLRKGELISQIIKTKPFNKDLLKESIPGIRELSVKSPREFLPLIKDLLANCGVAFVLVPHLKKTYAHGATKWLAPDKVMIVLSIRGSFSDIFWFSLFHEIAHVLLHNKKQVFIAHNNRAHDELETIEDEADNFASHNLINQRSYQSFLQNSLSEGSIRNLADELKIHPGIIVGRLQHDKIIRYDQYTHLRARYVWVS
ncbi:hypothetical protein DP73_15840 [Desulfosporosinus sp. HMP52]|uniref:HigA family addiction module antitoxin n=1 Tax=Desulfosporosinus sp. HMP52 TaxID=1487923 RepID=UPI00051F9FC9|nr:HigA family addiction module antitoxin [Desulfosporosinus sp. HMP52]KGK86723.1 hypothetical protein DP73_15840 [Desulfosporosinus sp. HMP52]